MIDLNNNYRNNNSKTTFIFITCLLNFMGMGLIVPILPDLLRQFSSDPIVVSTYFGYFASIYAVMQFIASPILGSLSDSYGRKPILLIALLGSGIDYLLMAFAPSLFLLFIGRTISGITSSSNAIATSYMIDISDNTNRSKNLGMLGAAWGIGLIAGPLIGGSLGTWHLKAPFLLAALLNILNFLFGLFILPESLHKEKRRLFKKSSLNPFSTIKKLVKFSDFSVPFLFFFMICIVGQVHMVNWTLFTETKFNWSAFDVSVSLAVFGIIVAFSQGVLIRWLMPKLGEEKALTIGIISCTLCYMLISFASHGWMLYLIMLMSTINGLMIPSFQSIISKKVKVNEQGELQGCLASIDSLAAIISPALYTYFFVMFTKPDTQLYFPGAAYFTASIICFISLFIRFKISPQKIKGLK